ncbi:sulfurtransferase [Tautonia marina]|uniref:sulfurtransferase n=1 Tax=Tautonia marina TaxID=2653855 RepID=UPI0012610BE3|nr:sulfurtransferase [Tautonia marina]
MMNAPLFVLILLGPLTPINPLNDGDQGQVARLLSFDEVEARLDDPDFVLLDVRPREDYDAGHLPGAVWIDTKEVERLAGEPGGLQDPDRWKTWIKRLGLTPDSAVYIYDANRQKDAARFWWLVGYLGVDEVGLINGGFPLWESEGRPVSTESVRVEPRDFPVTLRVDRHADRDTVLDAIRTGSAQVIDARSDAEFLGQVARSNRGGHVPTACHIEWSTLVDDEGRFLPEETVRPRLNAIGLEPGKPVITHCQGGGRASVDAFVLQRLGFPSRNYYLGWSDWGNAEETPVATNPQP